MNLRLRRFLATTTLAVACAAAGSAWAGARDDLKTFTTGLKGLDGQFSQQVFDSRGKVKESTSGRVALSAPRLFRWEYVRPHEQLIVADGKKVWMFEPDLEQATVREQGKEEQNSPLTALINPALLEQQYDVSEEAAARDGLQWLSLSPKRETEA
ncbi:MAG: outer membrane lipoprotein chaperone LolA, partial [Stenotrophomonas sp.]